MAVIFLASLKIGKILLTFLRFPPNAPVKDYHDSDGSVESGNGRPKSDVIVGLDKLDVAFVCLNHEREERTIYIELYLSLLYFALFFSSSFFL